MAGFFKENHTLVCEESSESQYIARHLSGTVEGNVESVWPGL